MHTPHLCVLYRPMLTLPYGKIMPTNKALGAQIREGDKANEKESRELVAKWGILNWGRALFPATAVVIGSWAMVAA